MFNCINFILFCFFLTSGFAFNRKNPATLWQTPTFPNSGLGPSKLVFSADGTVLITNPLAGLQASTGFPLWYDDTAVRDLALTDPSSEESQLLVACDDDRVFALDVHSGAAAWNTSLPSSKSRGLSRMTVSNNRVYLASTVSAANGTSLVVQSVNAMTGAVLWHVQTPPFVNASQYTAVGAGYGMVTVVFNNNHSNSTVFQFDAKTGRKLWMCSSESSCCALARNFSPPLMATSSILIVQKSAPMSVCQTDAGCYQFCALNARTGAPLWEWPVSRAVPGLLQQTVAHKGIVIATASLEGLNSPDPSHLLAFSAANGRPVWNTTYFGEESFALDQQGSGTLFLGDWCQVRVIDDVTTGRNPWNWTTSTDCGDGQMYGVAATTASHGLLAAGYAQKIYGASSLIAPSPPPQPHVKSEWCNTNVGSSQAGQWFEPLFIEDAAYQCGYSAVFCINQADGSTVWKYPATPPPVGGYALGSAVRAGPRGVAVAWNTGAVIALDRHNGSVLWSVAVPSDYNAALPIALSSTAPDGSLLLVTATVRKGGVRTRALIIDSQSGATVWSQVNSTWLSMGPSQQSPSAYLQRPSGDIVLFDLHAHKALWMCNWSFCRQAGWFSVFDGGRNPPIFYVITRPSIEDSPVLSAVASGQSEPVVLWNVTEFHGFASVSLTDQFVYYWSNNQYVVRQRANGLLDRSFAVSYGWDGAVSPVVIGNRLFGGSSKLVAYDIVKSNTLLSYSFGSFGRLTQTPAVVVNTTSDSLSIYTSVSGTGGGQSSFCKLTVTNLD